MGRILVQVAMVFIFAVAVLGFSREVVSIDCLEHPDGHTNGPADTPGEEESSSDDDVSDDEAAHNQRASHEPMLLELRDRWRDGHLPDSHPPSSLFRPPIG